MKKVYVVFLMICMLITSSLVYAEPASNNTKKPEISVLFGTPTIDREGQILQATIRVKNVKNLAAFQINLEYDPKVLQPIKDDGSPYEAQTPLKGGNVIANENFGTLSIASHKLEKGILNFGRSYTSLDAYKKSGKGETGGVIGIVKFKVLQKSTATLNFVKTSIIPSSKDGIYMADWDGKTIEDYQVVNSVLFEGEEKKPSNKPVENFKIDSITTKTETKPTGEKVVIWTCNATGKDLKYSYIITKDGKLIQQINGTTNNSASITIKDAGKYVVEFTVKDAYNTTITKQKELTINKPEDLIINSVTIKTKSTSPEGVFVSCECKATGKNILYSRKLFKDGKVFSSTDYSNSNAFNTTLKPGKYVVEFTVKDAYNRTQTKRSEEFIVPVSNTTSSTTERGEISVLFDLPAKVKIDKVGQIYEAKIRVKNIKNLASYQINLQYDPTLIQPIKEDGTPYASDTTLKGGNILINSAYNPVKSASHQLDKGILNFTGGYKLIDKYKKSAVPETDGTLGVIRFKLLQKKKTTLTLGFVPTPSMPLSKDGIYLYDWDGKINDYYSPIHSVVFTEVDNNSSDKPLEELKINSITANREAPLNAMATVTWTCDAKGKDLTYTYKLFWNGSIFAADENTKSNSFKRPVGEPGKYVLEVTVKDAYNRTVTKNSKELVVPVK